MPPSRVSLLVGGLVLAVTLPAAYLTERHSVPPHPEGWVLLAMLGTCGLIFGSLAAVGTFLGLRRAASESLSYRTGVSIALIFLVVSFFTNLIPLDPAIIFPGERTSDLPVYVRGGLLAVLMGGVVPYLIALTWRLTIVGGDREAR